MGSTYTEAAAPEFRYIPLSYSHEDSQASALRLILTLNPDWEGPGNNIEFVRFTDGITNTVCPSFPSASRETGNKLFRIRPRLTAPSSLKLST